MWKLCVVDDESNRTVVKLVRGDYSVGRAEDSTIRLTERNISRSHARIFRDVDEEWLIEDQGSYTGSFVNGERVAGKRPLKHGDTIQLGDYRLELMDEEQQAVDAKALDQAVSVAQLPDRLVVVQGPNVGTVFPLLEQKLLIGRGEECQIALDDASVSRVHVEVLRTEHGLMILDQGSSNGLRINGADLPSAMLRSGDVVELGDVRLKFVPSGVEDVVMQVSPVSAHPQDAMPVAVPRTSSGKGTVAVYGAAVALVGAVIVRALWPSDDSPTVTSVRVETAEVAEVVEGAEPVAPEHMQDGPSKILEEARGLADTNIVLAHRRLADIPQDSSLRQSDAFRVIEQRWADEILSAANVSPDLEERRRLLDTVAKTPEVDADRRSRAATELAKLDENLEAVDVADLPSADGKGRKTSKPTALAVNGKPKPPVAATPRRSVARLPPAPSPPKTQRVGMRPTVTPPVEQPSDDERDRPEADEPPPPPPKPAPKQEPKAESEVVREVPF